MIGNCTLKSILQDCNGSGFVSKYVTLGATVRFVSVLFDTGANVSVFMPILNDILADAIKSMISVCGFHKGKAIDGDLHGTLHGFALGQEEGTSGSLFTDEADTLEGTNHNLFSYRKLHDKGDYNCNIRQIGQGFSGLFRGPDDKKTHLIPFRYDKQNGQWFIDIVFCSDPHRAKKVGEIIQRLLQRQQAMTPQMEADVCVKNSRHKLADIMEKNQVSLYFRDGEHDEFITEQDIPAAVDYIRSNEDNTIFHMTREDCDNILGAAGDNPELFQEEATEILLTVLKSAETQHCPILPDVREACPGIKVPEIFQQHPTVPVKGLPRGSGKTGFRGAHDLLQQDYDVEQNDPTIKGVKHNLPSKFQKMSFDDFHNQYAHMGGLADCPGCPVCLQSKKSLGRVYRHETPARDSRIGYEIHLDTMTMEVDSIQGSKYVNVFYDKVAKMVFATYLTRRCESLETTEELIRAVRGHPDFQDHEHVLFSELCCDQAGEFGGDPKFLEMLKRNNVKHTPKDQVDKRDNAAAEYIIGVIQRRLRALMIDTNLPPAYWQYAMTALIELINVFPKHGDIISKWGDCPRPLEVFSKGRFDRTECNNTIRWWVKPGTPAILTRLKTKGGKQHLKGGNVTTLTRSVWGIAVASAGHMTVFETIDGRHITTKSYVTFSLKPGQNGWHFLGKIPPPLSKASMKRKSNEDFPTQNVVQLPYETDPMDQNEVIDSVHLMGTGGEGQPRVVVLDKDARVLRMDGETGELVGTKETILMPELKDQVDQLSDPDNEVHSADFLTNLLSRDPKAFTGRKCFQHFHEAIPEGVYQGKILSQQFFGEGTEKNSIFHVAFPPTASNPVHLTEYDDEEVKKYVIDCVDGKIPVEYPIEPGHLHVDDFDQYVTAGTETFFQVCEHMGIPRNEWKMYYLWLAGNFDYREGAESQESSIFFNDPYKKNNSEVRKNRLPKGTKLPYPAGPSWAETMRRREQEANTSNQEYMIRNAEEDQLRHTSEDIRINEKDTSNSCAGLRHLLVTSMDDASDKRLNLLDDMHSDRNVTSELLDLLSGDYGKGEGALQPLEYLGRSIDPGASRRQAKIAAQVARNDSVISDEDLKEYEHVHLDSTLYADETKEERKKELQHLMKKYVESGMCDEYIDENGRYSDCPKTVREAKTRKDWPLWEFAIKVELTAFRRKHVHSAQISLAQARADGLHQSPVPSHIIFEFKYEDGRNTKPKARWVLAGTRKNMRQLEHFFECFAPAPDTDSSRLLQALVVGRGLKRAKADVETAFLNSIVPTRERVPIILPLGMENFDASGDKLGIVVLLRGQYGSPSAAYLWFNTLREFTLTTFNQKGWSCKAMKQEPCMYLIKDPKGKRLWVLWHVDDADIASECVEMTAYVLKQYHDEFGITVSEPEMMLGVRRDITTETDEDGNTVTYNTLTQTPFLEDMFNKWKKKRADSGKPMSETPPKYPMHTEKKFSVAGTDSVPKPTENETRTTLDDYQSANGELLWAARQTKVECSYATSVNSRLMSVGGNAAMDSAMQCIHYMYSTRHRGIRFRSDGCDQLTAKYDAALDPDVKDGKSMGGWCIKLFGGPISCLSKKMAHTAVSSTHAEYQIQASVTKSVVHFRQLLFEMELEEHCQEATIVEGDNTQAVTLAVSPKVTSGNKFYLLDLHYCKDMNEEGHVQYRWVEGSKNTADIFTKALGQVLFEKFIDPLCGYAISPVEQLAPAMLGRPEAGNFPGWRHVRDRMQRTGLTREQQIYMDHLLRDPEMPAQTGRL